MKSVNLGKWQIISLLSRFSAVGVGIAQSIIIARILSVEEFGLIGIVTAIGALAGIAQHLGLASGTTREIAAAKESGDIYKIVLSSVVIKYAITIPVSLAMFLSSEYLATTRYNAPEIILPLKIFSLILLVQGVQSIFNSVLFGVQKFKHVFVYQIAIAIFSISIYIPLVSIYRIDGYFYALFLYNLVGSAALFYLAFPSLKGNIKKPVRSEFSKIFIRLFVLNLAIYLVKIMYTVWNRYGQLTLGETDTKLNLGYFTFALFYASKLLTVSDAITDVNLPIFSKEFTKNLDSFKALFHKNFDKLYIFILFVGLSAIYWASLVIQLFQLEDKYEVSYDLIPPLVLAFASYSYINLIKSSILIPAKLMYEMILGFASMLGGTALFYYLFSESLGKVTSMSYGMFIGALLGFLLITAFIKFKLNFSILTKELLFFTVYIMSLFVGHLLLDGFLIRLFFYSFLSLGLLYLVTALKVFDFKPLLERIIR